MNIATSLSFAADKPAVQSILKTDKINVIAVGLLKLQMLRKHKTLIPTLLTVLRGRIEFVMGDERFVFDAFDTFHIPVNIEHEVLALEQSIFTLTQEK
jgi:quercetin dioxygenase-like cupin family protein